ncbi:hypothetical protein D187_003166 [Cystobacter fuscus DSM 2262]|uniref:TIGR04222 domain-containing membrane protein n=1 Tax=Cystobacter fuscus (strain ATCC 25194 / DSM 2262 / NBRC 100088 / M29) TaxID=1242864 RepID=S9PAH2_CYSF2|nr:TIGR04222 domain-containing membrane protein [Cystobacter fuscus]EPX59262.1 hypothetical protein D187_003166 [Cystobacter fuscus DSM 2262]
MDPLDWNGQQFLTLYGPFLLLSFVGAVFWKKWLNQPGDAPTAVQLDMDPYQVAALEGEATTVMTAVVALVHGGALRLEEEAFSVVTAPPTGASGIERAVHAAVAAGYNSLEALREAARTEFSRLEESLRTRGFLRTPEQDTGYTQYPLWFFGAVLSIGAMKAMMGMLRQKPVELLVLLLLLGACGLLFLGRDHRLTGRGQKALAMLREMHEPLRLTASSEGSAETMRPRDVALAMGLFGMGALSFLDVHPLRDYLLPPAASGGGGGSGGDGGSSCGGSSSCGGGCGGCGGGGD